MTELSSEAKAALDQLIAAVFTKENIKKMEKAQAQVQSAYQIEQTLNKRDATGKLMYNDTEVNDVIAVTLLATNGKIELKGNFPKIMADFFRRVGVNQKMTKVQVHKAIDQYLLKHPPNTTLLAALRDLSTNQLGARGEQASAKYAKFMNQPQSQRPASAAEQKAGRGLESIADKLGRNLRG